jgi:hypothetical protein
MTTSKTLLSAMGDVKIIDRIRLQEIAQHDILLGLKDPSKSYVTKKISPILGLIFLLVLPLCLIELSIVKKYKYFYINIVENDLTNEIKDLLVHVYSTKRFNKILGKFFIIPLRIYSHIIRKEWLLSDGSFILKLLNLVFEWYLDRFISAMRQKIFFIKEDYHGETSMLASICATVDNIKLVSFQHEAMNLSDIKRDSIYPGSRAAIQIAHDSNTQRVFIELSGERCTILKSVPCYSYRQFNISDTTHIVFIGDGTDSVRRIAFDLLGKFSTHSRVCHCTYMTYIGESNITSKIFDIDSSINYKKFISGQHQIIFLGSISTVLYDAYMAGHKVILLDKNEIVQSDSLRALGCFNVISENCNPLEVLEVEINRVNTYVREQECLDPNIIVQLILSKNGIINNFDSSVIV